MEENINNQTTPQATPAAPTSSVPSTTSSEAGSTGPKSNKMLLFVILGIALVVVIGTIYVMMLAQTSKPNTTPEPTPVVAAPTPTVTPTPTPSAEEINSMDLGNPQEDLNIIDQDVNAL